MLPIPPAGLTPAGAFVAQTFDDPRRPPGILADAIDPETGEYRSILKGADPIDQQVLIALRTRRASGAAVLNDGQELHKITKVDDVAKPMIEGEVRRALARLIDNRDIRLERAEAIVDQDKDYVDVVVEFSNQRARSNPRRAVTVTP